MNPYAMQPRLRAKGNLSYQEFLRVLEMFWTESHPGIPFQAGFDNSMGQYPIITYRLDLQKSYPSEPKPRLREEIKVLDQDTVIQIQGQRFQSVITFTIMTQVDPHNAETLVDEFINFMMTMQPVFKELGASELVYVRRLPDSADSRPGEGVVSRSVSYMLTTERIIKTDIKKIEAIVVRARLLLTEGKVIFNAVPSQGTITVNGASYAMGDRVMITAGNLPLPPELHAGYYLISNLVISANSRQYGLSAIEYHTDVATPGETHIPIASLSAGSGYIGLVPESDVITGLLDSQSGEYN